MLSALGCLLGLAGCGSTRTGHTGTLTGGRTTPATTATTATTATVPAAASGSTQTIPARLLAGMRPIGAGPRFHPAVTGRPTGGCGARPGAEEAHVELFGANRVVLIPAGVGQAAHCDGNAVTTDPTGTVHFRPGATLADLFSAWGQPLTPTRLASFTGTVRYYVAGRRVRAVPPLRQHAEIVIEVGPYVPPHRAYTFPAGL